MNKISGIKVLINDKEISCHSISGPSGAGDRQSLSLADHAGITFDVVEPDEFEYIMKLNHDKTVKIGVRFEDVEWITHGYIIGSYISFRENYLFVKIKELLNKLFPNIINKPEILMNVEYKMVGSIEEIPVI